MQVTQYPKNADGTPMDLLVGVLTDASGNGGARLTDVPVGPDKAPIDAVGLVLVDSGGVPATPLTASLFVASVAEMQTTNPVPYPQLFLTEDGRKGLFTRKNYVDYVNLVAADTTTGIAVRSTQNPNYVWIRQFEGPVNPAWFGVVEGDAAGANGVSNDVALDAMLATLRVRAFNVITNYQNLEPVHFSGGLFEFATTIELTDGTIIIEGIDTGFPSARGTQLKFPAGVTGLRVQRFNTSGAATTDGVTHRGGDGAIIRNLSLLGAYVAAEAEAHGIQLRARAALYNVKIDSFEGDGIYGYATAGGAQEGNANNTSIYGGRIQGCRNGIFLDGSDSNIWNVVGLDCSSNRQWGFYDSSFLGNSFFGCHASANGLVSGTIPTIVSDGVNRYTVVDGQEAGASVNAPSGTTSHNTWWYYNGAGGVSAGNNITNWVNGTTYRAGGSYIADNGNARSLFSGCYHEGGQGKPQIASPSIALGGTGMAENNLGTGTSIYSGIGGYLFANNGFKTVIADATSTKEVLLGENGSKTTIMLFKDTVVATSSYRLKFNGADVQLDYANSNSNRPFLISGPTTAQFFGTGAAVFHAFYPTKLMVGDTVGNARQISNGTVVPATNAHGAGELVINRTPAVGGIGAWICRTAGTPGTWEAFGIVGAVRAAAITVTYGAPAGLTYAAPGVTYAAPGTTYVAPSGGTTIDTQGRASLAQLAVDVTALKASLAQAAVDEAALRASLAQAAVDEAASRAKILQLAADNVDLRTKLAAANLTA